MSGFDHDLAGVPGDAVELNVEDNVPTIGAERTALQGERESMRCR
jgi:hypothetical protein